MSEPCTFSQWASTAERVVSGGLAVAWYDRGPRDGPVVTYLHGYPSSSHDVAGLVEPLAQRRIVTLDFPGFGASDKPSGHAYSIHACADAVEAVWAAAGVERTVLASHDYGVSVGQELLARRSEGSLDVAVTSAVWHNGGLYPDLHRPTVGQQLLADPEHGAEVAAAMTEDLFRGGIAVTWGTRREMTDAEIHQMWLSMERDGGVRIADQLLHYLADRRANASRWADALERNGLEQRFVWGDLDPVSGAHMIERVEERLPTATVVRLADVGHWPPLEAPAEVTTAILASPI